MPGMERHGAWHPAPSEARAGTRGGGWGFVQGVFASGMPAGERGAGRWALQSPVHTRLGRCQEGPLETQLCVGSSGTCTPVLT